jgi:hypothetical protein
MFMAKLLGVLFWPAGAVRGRAYEAYSIRKADRWKPVAWPQPAARANGSQRQCRIETLPILPETVGDEPANKSEKRRPKPPVPPPQLRGVWSG